MHVEPQAPLQQVIGPPGRGLRSSGGCLSHRKALRPCLCLRARVYHRMSTDESDRRSPDQRALLSSYGRARPRVKSAQAVPAGPASASAAAAAAAANGMR